MTQEERKKQQELLHPGNCCLPSKKWEQMLESENYYIYSLVNETTDKPEATILLADAEFAVNARASINFHPYVNTRTLDQRPRVFNSHKVVCLEVLPEGSGVRSDSDLNAESSQIFASWYESLETVDEYSDWDANRPDQRRAAVDFIQKRKEVNNGD
jgi:hypothetical protein